MVKLRLAIDFDGTIVHNKYPKIGRFRKGAAKYLRALHLDGHFIIINTCRALKYENAAINYLAKHSVYFDLVNSNDPNLIRQFGMDCRKISADIYIDDKNLGGVPSWKNIYKRIKQYAIKESLQS